MAVLLLLATTGCWRNEPSLTESGRGFPDVSIEFPERARAGSVQTAVLHVSNAGPGDITNVRVDFTLVGQARAGGAAEALVGFGRRDRAVVGVDPEPVARSVDGGYVFEGLEEGESTTISFEIRIPRERGVAANAIIVSDAQEPDRARGVRLETVVQG